MNVEQLLLLKSRLAEGLQQNPQSSSLKLVSDVLLDLETEIAELRTQPKPWPTGGLVESPSYKKLLDQLVRAAKRVSIIEASLRRTTRYPNESPAPEWTELLRVIAESEKLL